MKVASVAEAKARLSGYLRDAQAGNVVVITSHGRPVARIVTAEADGRAMVREARKPWGAVHKVRGVEVHPEVDPLKDLWADRARR